MDLSIKEFMTYAETHYGDKYAFQWIEGNADEPEKRTFTEFFRDVRRFSAFLKQVLPDIRGKHIGFCASNSYYYAVCALGTLHAGAVVVLINNRNTPENIVSEVVRADVNLLLTDAASAKIADSVPETVNCFDITAYRACNAEDHDITDAASSELALLIFTSGTSGKSKCVMLSFRNLFGFVENAGNMLKDVDTLNQVKQMNLVTERFFMMLPLCHISAFTELLDCLYYGHLCSLCTDFRFLIRDIQKMPSDYTVAVPMIFDAWYKELKRGSKRSLGEIRVILCGGATVEPERIQTFVENEIALMVCYGMSETSGGGTHNLVNLTEKTNSIGRLSSDAFRCKFVENEIWLQGTPVMSGYYKDPEETAKAMSDGWLMTGDLGYMDEEGFIYMTGRKKNLIILSSGENVSPEELESYVNQCDAVKEVLVMEKNGKICAVIYCEAGDQEEITAYVAQVNKKLPIFKRISAVEFTAVPLARTVSGKVQRN